MLPPDRSVCSKPRFNCTLSQPGEACRLPTARKSGEKRGRDRGGSRVNKLLPFAVMAVLSSAAARAEDPVQTAPPVAPAAAAPATPPATATAKPEEKPASCDDTLGVSRVAEVDTAGGALFGDQYPPTTLLQ